MTLSEEKVMDIIKESNISLLSVAYSTRSVETVSIQRLPVFLSAAEHLNFTRAAEEQCISQTAVSQQIKLLEQELGYALFVRGKRGVSLTPAGEVFYRQCRQLLIRYNDAAAQGKKIALGSATDLRIGYAGAYELWTIVAQIRKYHRLYPEAAFSFQLGSNRSLLTALAEGRLDMAVLSGFGVVLDFGVAVGFGVLEGFGVAVGSGVGVGMGEGVGVGCTNVPNDSLHSAPFCQMIAAFAVSAAASPESVKNSALSPRRTRRKADAKR